jgi:glycosyltransferase involved in cell wall biosynthesis
MKDINDGISVVIPAGGRGRLHLLDATLASIRRCAGVEQIILSEFGPAPDSLDLARKWGADHILTHSTGPYERAVALNAGTRLARREVVLWTDGDFLFDADFMAQSQAEFLASGADYFYGHSAIHYLDQSDSAQVLAGTRHPAQCPPIRILSAMDGNPGGLGFVRASFANRTGGMVEGFKGWGSEDHAWLHKARLLGRVAVTRSRRLVWHLFHGDSGSHTVEAWRRASARNPFTHQNWQLFDRLRAIEDRETYLRAFPPSERAAVPWPVAARIAFVVAPVESPLRALAEEWAERLHRLYGLDIALVCTDVSDIAQALGRIQCDTIVGFADDARSATALGGAPGLAHGLLVLGEEAGVPIHPDCGPLLLAPSEAAVRALRARGLPVWHRAWSNDDAIGYPLAPPIIAPLSHLVGRQRQWKVRIEVDRAVIPASASEGPRFWYVGLHDADDVEIAREDADHVEIASVLSRGGDRVVIERQVVSLRPPARWTVWPVDRRGCWTERLSGPAAAERVA